MRRSITAARFGSPLILLTVFRGSSSGGAAGVKSLKTRRAFKVRASVMERLENWNLLSSAYNNGRRDEGRSIEFERLLVRMPAAFSFGCQRVSKLAYSEFWRYLGTP